ncbi:ABC transporter permease [Dactylosporangium matsuzakiense]|uniref:Peptide transport permease protein n=1 Tax=Dactylosporangium matsuzakiense TaxID=53360 RepID=A0A9W6KES0_9ACTN|nr:ABC transporter permease [Dactylosporangium matsuzakiense]GLK99309.1 putative peptide transport permease protein [Dactylosporangium matsuzakiense]
MVAFLARRLAYYLVLLVTAAALSYGLAATALSPRAYFQARQVPPPPAQIDRQLRAIGLDPQEPVTTRFAGWAGRALHGDLGLSITGSSVNAEFGRRIGVSLRLLLLGTTLGIAAGIATGVWGAVRQYRLSDRTFTVVAFLLLSTPTFLIALLLKIAALAGNRAAGRQVIAFTGESTPGLTGSMLDHVADRAGHLLLPTLSIGLVTLATYSRYQRNVMLDVLGADYLRTATAKGLSRRTVLVKHGLRTVLIPMSTFFAFGFLGVLTGATFTEKIFGWHGMGEWFIDSVNNNDVNAIVAVNLFAAVTVLLAGLLADVLHALLDPRVRLGRRG